MNNTAKLSAAVAGGYLLGRTKKGKAAIGLAIFLAGRRAGQAGSLSALLPSGGAAKALGQFGGPMASVVRRAATSAIESRVNALADGLGERTNRLRGGAGEAAKKIGGSRSEEAGESADSQGEQPEGKGGPEGSAPAADESGPDGGDESSSTPARTPQKAAKSAGRAAARRVPGRSREPSRSS